MLTVPRGDVVVGRAVGVGDRAVTDSAPIAFEHLAQGAGTPADAIGEGDDAPRSRPLVCNRLKLPPSALRCTQDAPHLRTRRCAEQLEGRFDAHT
jgi:hypothetical protein